MFIVYIFAIAISVIVAFVLIHLARMTGHVEKDSSHNEIINRDSTYNHSDESLNKILNEEIKGFVGSKSKQKAVTEKLSMIMNKQIDEKINSTTKELSQKYEKIIDEKAKSEDIAWKTYNKVLGDKRKTESVIRSVAEGVVVVDVNGNVIMLNPAAEKLLATSKKDKVGKSISDNIREEQVVSLFKGGADSDQEIEVVGEGDEAKKIIRASSAVIENEDGQTVGMVSVLSDITKQRALDRMKSQFIANVTHELRTPLIAIDKSIEILFSEQAGNLSETQEQFLSLAARNLKRLRALIDDLLDLAKLEGGIMRIKCVDHRIEDVVNESVEIVNSWAGTKNIKIYRKIQDNLPTVYIDESRIIQVLNNLLSNAIKFTSKGGSIGVIVSSDEIKREVQVTVKDTGIGIDKDKLEKAFDKFYQIGESTPADIRGTGIGLSIAKEIIELHEGRIWIESEKGRGSEFIFTLPLR